MILEEEGLDWKARLALLRAVDALQETETVELFNLQHDVSEEWNLAKQHPDIVEGLKKTMEDFDREMQANIRPPMLRSK